MKITILGSGNVATHLATELHRVGHHILQIYSRHLEHAQLLAQKVKAQATDEIAFLLPDADCYLICVSDRAISELVAQIGFEPNLIVHTSGSIPMSVLSKFKNHGVLYPLQTFSKDREIDISKIPICIEATHNEAIEQLKLLAKSLSNNLFEMNSEQRKQCHLAAVFANNFVNHMYVLAEQLLRENNLPFELIKPLILETALKVQQLSPTDSQTGPAIRNDFLVMDEHLRLLKSIKLEKIYSFVSNSIKDSSESKKD